jgi:hypothetical protein
MRCRVTIHSPSTLPPAFYLPEPYVSDSSCVFLPTCWLSKNQFLYLVVSDMSNVLNGSIRTHNRFSGCPDLSFTIFSPTEDCTSENAQDFRTLMQLSLFHMQRPHSSEVGSLPPHACHSISAGLTISLQRGIFGCGVKKTWVGKWGVLGC